MRPAQIEAGACGKLKGDLADNGEGPENMGTQARRKSMPPVSEIRDDFRTWPHEKETQSPCAIQRARRSDEPPSPSLRSGLGSRSPLVGLFKSSSAAFQIKMGEVEAQKSRLTI